MATMTDTPRIYVACLASYNAGTLHGEWIDADQDADDIRAEIAAMLRKSPEPNVLVDCPDCDSTGADQCKTCGGRGKVPSAEEYAIHDYENFGVRLEEFSGIDKIAMLAQGIAEHGAAFAAWVDNIGLEHLDDPDEFTDAYIGEYDSVKDYAEQSLDEQGVFKDVPAMLQNYFDFDGYARDLVTGGDIWSHRDNETGRTYIFHS